MRTAGRRGIRVLVFVLAVTIYSLMWTVMQTLRLQRRRQQPVVLQPFVRVAQVIHGSGWPVHENFMF